MPSVSFWSPKKLDVTWLGNQSIVLFRLEYFGQQWEHEGLPGLRLGAGEAFGASGYVRAEGDWGFGVV
jgi:hypothetical protein